MKIYKDNKLTKELEDKTFDLGIVPAGETKQYKFWVFNDTTANLKELKFIVDHDEVKILKYPEELHSDEIGELVLEWNPLITVKQGLKTRLKVTGKELWG